MSFILDALKKSEAERQRQSVPGLMDAGMAPRRRGLPLWAIVIGALLGLNVVVLGVVLIRQQLPATTQSAHVDATASRAATRATPPAPPADADQPAQLSAHFSPLDSTPVYAPEIPVDDAGGAAAPAVVAARRERSDPALNSAQPAANSSSQDDEVLPEISELNLTGAQALPELHLDVHVYATTTAERFVYINMRKYREGAVLQEGLTVERIRRDGVVLNYQGLRFLLPRR
ncbi:MAG: general secretion pathway protein GspB [Steroidobacterales bacterium]